MKQNILHIDKRDNVLVALENLAKGDTIIFNGIDYTIQQDVPAKHKFFMHDMQQGDNVIMYGVVVGKVQNDIRKGDLMTTDNTLHESEQYQIRPTRYLWSMPDTSRFSDKVFYGYHRSDGKVGTANYWLFLPTVFCENRNLDVIRESLQNELGYSVVDKYKRFTHALAEAFKKGQDLDSVDLSVSSTQKNSDTVFENIDGIKFLNHQGGCGGTRQDAETLSRLLAAYTDHPNVAGVTVLSLGCQHLQVSNFLADLKSRNPKFDKPLLIFEQQKYPSEEQLIKDAIKMTFLELIKVNKIERKPAHISKLNIGVKCGGSDGFSGISANPAVGHCADMLAAVGGKVMLAEFPELYGVEQQLIDRSVNTKVAEKFIRLMEGYNSLANMVHSGFHMNPSPGNIKDGLITDAIKSAGAAKKGGTSPVVDVLDYTEPCIKPGLSLVCTPGSDVEATTGLTASGATLILFTTGLGTPTGNPICPVIKISSNTSLANRMHDIIDIDAGSVITGEKSIQQMGEKILSYCIAAASGEVTPMAVILNQDDFIPWKRGVSL